MDHGRGLSVHWSTIGLVKEGNSDTRSSVSGRPRGHHAAGSEPPPDKHHTTPLPEVPGVVTARVTDAGMVVAGAGAGVGEDGELQGTRFQFSKMSLWTMTAVAQQHECTECH